MSKNIQAKPINIEGTDENMDYVDTLMAAEEAENTASSSSVPTTQPYESEPDSQDVGRTATGRRYQTVKRNGKFTRIYSSDAGPYSPNRAGTTEQATGAVSTTPRVEPQEVMIRVRSSHFKHMSVIVRGSWGKNNSFHLELLSLIGKWAKTWLKTMELPSGTASSSASSSDLFVPRLASEATIVHFLYCSPSCAQLNFICSNCSRLCHAAINPGLYMMAKNMNMRGKHSNFKIASMEVYFGENNAEDAVIDQPHYTSLVVNDDDVSLYFRIQ